MLRQSLIALAIISLSVPAFAALPAAANPTLVNVPQLSGGIVIGVTGYYLQPSATQGDLDYASINTFTTNATTSNFSSVKMIEPDYDWGWGINLGYVFPDTGNDIDASYFNLNTKDSDSISAIGANSISPIGNVFNFPLADPAILNPAFNNTATAEAKYDIDQVNVSAGQFINIGCRLIMHPYLGLTWLQLERDLDTSYLNSSTIFASPTTIVQTQTTGFTERSRFRGVGPLAGLDATYFITHGLGVAAHLNGALLVGNIDESTNAVVQQSITATNSAGSSVFNSISSTLGFGTNNSIRKVVPMVTGRLGLDWSWIFNENSDSDLTVEAGWMVANYFNAVDRINTNTTLQNGYVSPMIASANVTARSTSDVGLNGPYANLVFKA